MRADVMKIIRTSAEMRETAASLRRAGRRIGFVPTMGCLHDGHLSLVRLARQHADVVVLSLFVNPTQFGPQEDFNKYPRDFARDEALCRTAGVDVLFHPATEDMYPGGHSTFVEETALSRGLCGVTRPGHFRGVTTVVARLFNIVLPDIAVFGEKDAQQLRVIRRMTRDMGFGIGIIPGPTMREPDGLAMSSRNQYLSPPERAQALVLKRALDKAAALYAAGERRSETFLVAMRSILNSAPLARIDYVEIVDDETLDQVVAIERPALVALAVFVGKTRLIDNVVLGLPH